MQEIEEMIISMVAIVIAVAVAFSPLGVNVFFSENFLETAVVLFFTIGIGFVAHELGHKYMAERFGSAARFVMWPTGILLMLVLAFSVGIVFAAPGAVYIFKRFMSNRENGIISLAGPVVNMALFIFFALIILSAGFLDFKLTSLVMSISMWGMKINGLLAVFNLLPIFILDGAKIFRWNIGIWIIAFVISVFMFLIDPSTLV